MSQKITRTSVRSARRHNWSPEAREVIIKAAKNGNLLRREVAALYNGKLNGGQLLTTAGVTGILHRHDAESRQEATRKRENAAYMRQGFDQTNRDLNNHRQNILTLRHLRLVMPNDTIEPVTISHISYSPPVPQTGISALYLENMQDGQCRMITSESADGISICCGRACKRKATRTSNPLSKFYSYCEDCRSVVEDPKSAQSRIRFEKSTARQLSRYY